MHSKIHSFITSKCDKNECKLAKRLSLSDKPSRVELEMKTEKNF